MYIGCVLYTHVSYMRIVSNITQVSILHCVMQTFFSVSYSVISVSL